MPRSFKIEIRANLALWPAFRYPLLRNNHVSQTPGDLSRPKLTADALLFHDRIDVFQGLRRCLIERLDELLDVLPALGIEVFADGAASRLEFRILGHFGEGLPI